MDLARGFAARHASRFAAYLALQCALMRHYVARGGTEEDFCARLAPVFRQKYAKLLT